LHALGELEGHGAHRKFHHAAGQIALASHKLGKDFFLYASHGNYSAANDTVATGVVLPTNPNSSLELAIHVIDGASPFRHAGHQVLFLGP
jgi:hypothetical protein